MSPKFCPALPPSGASPSISVRGGRNLPRPLALPAVTQVRAPPDCTAPQAPLPEIRESRNRGRSSTHKRKRRLGPCTFAKDRPTMSAARFVAKSPLDHPVLLQRDSTGSPKPDQRACFSLAWGGWAPGFRPPRAFGGGCCEVSWSQLGRKYAPEKPPSPPGCIYRPGKTFWEGLYRVKLGPRPAPPAIVAARRGT